MPQEKVSIKELARILPDEARFAINEPPSRPPSLLWFETEPDIHAATWRHAGHRLSGIILDADGLVEIRPKVQWRAKEGDAYHSATADGRTTVSYESGDEYDGRMYAAGNYWRTAALAQAYERARHELAMKLHAEIDE